MGNIVPSIVEIWEMKQLRHLCIDQVYLHEPPPIAAIEGHSNLKLQTLGRISNLNLSEWVVTRIPNIKKLKIHYNNLLEDLDKGKDYRLNNLQHLHKLESLNISINSYSGGFCKTYFGENLILPPSLKKLNLSETCIPWERMTIIGCLPNLEVLKLRNGSFIGKEWKPIEEQFLSLKYLSFSCIELKLWDADSIHFPKLEQLSLGWMYDLEKIPLGIGEIPTLRSIQLQFCGSWVVKSAIDILNEQESQGNDEIKVEVWLPGTQLKNLEARDNLKVHHFFS